jgi:hypothetical protein
MKIKKLFIAVLFIGVLFSCNKDDDGNGNSSSDIVGTWKLEEVDYTSTATQSGITTDGVGEAYDIDGSITFNIDNSYTADTVYSVHLTVSMNGIEAGMYDVENLSATGQNGTWSMEGDQLTFTANGNTDTMTVTLSNDNNTLTLDGTTERTIEGVLATVHIIGVYNRQ